MTNVIVDKAATHDASYYDAIFTEILDGLPELLDRIPQPERDAIEKKMDSLHYLLSESVKTIMNQITAVENGVLAIALVRKATLEHIEKCRACPHGCPHIDPEEVVKSA